MSTDCLILLKTFEFAERAHRGQSRKYTNTPYIEHPIEVAELLARIGMPLPVIQTGLLHDTKEDCGVTDEVLTAMFGPEVALLVDEVTDRYTAERFKGVKGMGRDERKRLECLRMSTVSAHAQSVKLADIISNTRTIAALDPKFAKAKYMPEKVALLGVLTRGHPGLHQMATAQVRAFYEMRP